MRGRVAALVAGFVVLLVAAAAAAVVLRPDGATGPGPSGSGAPSRPGGSTSRTAPSTQPTEGRTTITPCPRQDAVRLTVLSLNVHAGRTKAGRLDLARIGAELRSWDADLVLLQEVDRGRERTAGVHQARRLASRLGFRYVYGPTRRVRPGSTGNAIISRWPVTDVARRGLPLSSGAFRRGLVRATVDVRGLEIDVFVTHLDHLSPGVRLAQAHAVAAAVRRSSHPVVLGGDLNAEPGMPPVRILERAGLVDAWSVAGHAEGLTVPAPAPRRRIDYVMADASFTPVRSRVMLSLVSDHRAVRTTYDVLPQRC